MRRRGKPAWDEGPATLDLDFSGDAIDLLLYRGPIHKLRLRPTGLVRVAKGARVEFEVVGWERLESEGMERLP